MKHRTVPHWIAQDVRCGTVQSSAVFRRTVFGFRLLFLHASLDCLVIFALFLSHFPHFSSV